MTGEAQRLPRRLSTLETWGFGFTVLLFWLVADFAATNLAALGVDFPAWPIQFTLLGAIYLTAFSGVRVLSVVHLCFVLPSLGLLLAFAVHGLGFTLAASGPTASGEPRALPSAGGWLAAYFLIVYTTYGIETAAAFTADSRHPKATLNCLLAAALLLPVVMVGGSLFLAHAGPTLQPDPSAGAVLESAGVSLWGTFTPFGVAFMVASSMVLACATAVAVAPRVAWQLSRDGLLNPALGVLGRDGVPRRSMAVRHPSGRRRRGAAPHGGPF